MNTKHSVWKKLVAAGSTLGALVVGVGSAHANPVTLGPLDQAPGLATLGGKSVGFTVHSYLVYAASDITSVNPIFGTSYTNKAVPNCAFTGATVTQPGTNMVDGDIWYVGCLGAYNGLTVTVTIAP